MTIKLKHIKSLTINTKISVSVIVCYIIMIPFLHPRGFDEYFPAFKSFFTMWLYLSMALSAVVFFTEFFKESEQYRNCIFPLLIYYSASVAITLVVQRGLGAGLQKMFATPTLGLLCGYYMKHDSKMLLKCLSNIVLIVLGLTVLVFNPIFFGQYFRDEIHLMFIGHVQIGAQYGLVGIVLAFLISRQDGWNKRAQLLVIMSVVTMILSLTSSSLLSLCILAMGLIYRKYSKSCKLLKLKPCYYFMMYIIMNTGLYLVLKRNNWLSPFKYLSLNGRQFIWKEGIALFQRKPYLGYGVHGVLIKVFWSKWVKGGETGMNYTHNQMLQVMLDGGLILLICFLLMLFFYIKNFQKAPANARTFSNVCLILILVIMTVESTFEYHYIIMIISLLAYSSELYCRKDVFLRQALRGGTKR